MDLHVAVVPGNDALGDGQAQPGALVLVVAVQAGKGLEDALTISGSMPRPLSSTWMRHSVPRRSPVTRTQAALPGGW